MTRDRTAYERSVLSEVRMLLDFVAGNGAINLSALTVPDVGTLGKQLGPQEILVRLDGIEKSLRDPRGRTLGDGDFAFLQLVRDAVSRMARPATGLTIAFTALVVGRRRSNHAESRATLAEEAYPALVQNARWMRGTQIVLTLLALGFTLIAIWVASEVALGKAVLNNLDTLRAQIWTHCGRSRPG